MNPLNDYIIIKPDDVEEKTSSGIYLPKSATKNSVNTGEVIAISDAINNPQVKVGDKVIFGAYARDTIKLDDDEFLIMQEKDLKMKI